MSEEAQSNYEYIEDIKKQFFTGKIDYETAKKELEPIIDKIYKKQQVIAKKYGKRAYKLRVSSILH